jgi:hypothetical protein
VWPPGQPDASPRPVPLGSFYPIDFALGPAGSSYVTEPMPHFRSALCRLTATGQVLWTAVASPDGQPFSTARQRRR